MNNDALSFLSNDHQKVIRLFDQFAALDNDSLTAKQQIAEMICQELTIHATIEEELFYPKVSQVIDDDDIIEEALEEHAAAKELIAQIQEMDAGDDSYNERVDFLYEQIEHHIREEEDRISPWSRDPM